VKFVLIEEDLVPTGALFPRYAKLEVTVEHRPPPCHPSATTGAALPPAAHATSDLGARLRSPPAHRALRVNPALPQSLERLSIELVVSATSLSSCVLSL
jgi:hypothetical protein